MILELLSAAGFLIATYIFVTIHRHGQLACPLGKSCNEIVESEYGKMFGIRNEVLGMLYYAAVFVAAFFGILVPPWMALVFTGVAALLALRFIYIQAFVLRKWCDFCLGSNFISLAIFIVVLLAPTV